MKSGVAHKPEAPVAIACDVIGRTGDKLRLRACGSRDLFDDPFAGMTVGSALLIDVSYPDGGESCAADVIGLPRAGVVEVALRAELELGKGRVVRVVKR